VKKLLLLGLPLLPVWGCVSQAPPPQPAAALSVTPITTNAFDGNYVTPVVSARTVTCPDLPPLPALTISNGSAVWQGPNLAFQGYVNPQGTLTMNSNAGQTLQGQIDQMRVLRAHVAGPNCAYDVTFNS
jgi:hypothetical protein